MSADTIQGFRLSPQQQRVWSLQQIDDGQPYRVRGVIAIDGPVDRLLLKASVDRVIQQHEILRTCFRSLPGMSMPLQVILEQSDPWEADRDWREQTHGAAAQQLTVLLQQARQAPFDLARGLLARFSLVRLASDRHALLVDISALCADAASLSNLLREIRGAYAACLGAAGADGEVMQYADFAEWQHELLESEETAAGRAYWRKQDLNLATLRLPFERPRAGTGFAPQTLAVSVRPEVIARAQACVQDQQVALSSIVLACWSMLLWRLTREADMVVAVAYDGRRYEELQRAIGLFARYLPIRIALEPGLPFGALLARIASALQDAYARQEYFSWDRAEADPSGQPQPSFFPFHFDFDPAPERIDVGGIGFALAQHDACIDRFNLKLSCHAQGTTLLLTLHYDSNTFHQADIARLGDQFVALLDSAAPDSAIERLKMLSPAERRLLLRDSARAEFPGYMCIHQRFEQQVARVPANVAVVCEDQQLTYAELDDRAGRLAQCLRALSAGPERIVALCVERSVDMIVGMLGILKSGAAYVPLDPLLPPERLAFMLEDSGAVVLMTTTDDRRPMNPMTR